MKNLNLIALILISTQTFAASSFNEVRDVLFVAPTSKNAEVKNEIKVYEQGLLPHYEVTADKFIENGVNRLLDRATKTLSDKNDYYPRLEKLVHANGACFTGTWNITESNSYTGYFKQGSKALFVGRSSVTLSETEKQDPRGIAFAGKIFPTLDPDKKVNTENFFLVDVLMGTLRDRYLDTKMTNNPSLGFRFDLVIMAIKIAKTFGLVDSNPLYRPLDNIASMGLKSSDEVSAPRFMMIKADRSTTRNNENDFREELNIQAHHPNGIQFNIMVNNQTANQDDKSWKKIGFIKLDESTVSYGCDRRLHFAHPKINK